MNQPIGWKDHHLSEIWQCFHSNVDFFFSFKKVEGWMTNTKLKSLSDRLKWNWYIHTKGKTVWCWRRTVYYTWEFIRKISIFFWILMKIFKTSKLIYTSEHLWTVINYLQNRSCSFLKTSRLGLTLQFMNINIRNSSMLTIICDYMMGWILWRT